MCRGYKEMKNKNLSGAVPITALLVVFILACAFNLWITPEEKIIGWEHQTQLTEDVVYYSDSKLEESSYSEPVLFPKDTMIKVCADITPKTADSGQSGTDYSFTGSFIYWEQGKIMPVTVTTDWALCREQSSEGFDTAYVSAIHISRLYKYEEILSGFDKAKEDCIKKDKDMRLKNLLVGTVPVIGLAVGMLILRHAKVKNGQSANKLFWIFMIIDCVLVIYGLMKLFQWVYGI